MPSRFFVRGAEVPGTFDLEDLPDLVPIARWAIAAVAILIALGIAGSVSGAWTTLLLWVNRVPFDPAQAVNDPIFNQDVSFFLFELPTLRWAQSLFNGLLLASLLVAPGETWSTTLSGIALPPLAVTFK